MSRGRGLKRFNSDSQRQINDTHPDIFEMKHLAAYLLLGLGGNTSPSAKDVKAVLESVGIEADDERLKKLLSELKGKDINQVTICPRHATTSRVTDYGSSS